MSLDVWLTAKRPTEVYSRNITHNLSKMAREAGVYYTLWNPGAVHAGDLIQPLRNGLGTLLASPSHFKQFNPDNGWGDYDGLVEFVAEYLDACQANPDAEIGISR